MHYFYEDKGQSLRAEVGTSLEFGAHLHNHVELICMRSGRAKAVVDSQEVIICGGDAFIVFPNQVHQYYKIDLEDYIVIILPYDLCSDFKSIFEHKLPLSPLIQNAGNSERIFSLAEEIVRVQASGHPYKKPILKGYFYVLLGELLTKMPLRENTATDSNTIKSILLYCAQNYEKDISLETLADALHLSKYYISHLFSQKLQMGFQDYIGMLRVSEACRMLAASEQSITEISYASGFNCTRSFNRLFLKYTGQTPRQYRSTLSETQSSS